jgi:hypothetical protein
MVLYQWYYNRVSRNNHSVIKIMADFDSRKHWLQSNLDLLATTFQREIVGIHNPT